PRLGSAHRATCQVVNGTFRPYASLFTQMRSPSTIVGRIDPLGTTFQSATADLNDARTNTSTASGRSCFRQNASVLLFQFIAGSLIDFPPYHASVGRLLHRNR